MQHSIETEYRHQRLAFLFGVCMIFVVAATPSAAQAQSTGATHRCQSLDRTHNRWTDLLQQYVHNGRVSYSQWKAGGQDKLDAYLLSLEGVCQRDYQTWTNADKIALWVNAYNAYTVRLILNHYPIKSIRDIGFLPGAAWREAFIPSPYLEGHTLTLNAIEHDILRKRFDEPRIHFALVCASLACPALRSEAYQGTLLGSQLQDQGQLFLQDLRWNRFDRKTGRLYLSKIFDWFRKDFERDGNTLSQFVAPFFERRVSAAVGASTSVEFLDYDWRLNDR